MAPQHPGPTRGHQIQRPRVTPLLGTSSYAFPESASGAVTPHPLLVWWSVLFALSMLARYEPERWYKHISVASSPEAVPIENLLNLAMSSVPRTLLQVFTQLREQLAT